MKITEMLMRRGYCAPAGDDGSESGGGAATDEDIKGQSGDDGGSESDDESDSDDDGATGDDDSDSDDDDKSKLSEKEAALLKDLMKKKGQNKELRNEVAELKKTLSKFDGIDLDEVKSMMKEVKERETKELERKGQWDTLKQRMAEEHENSVQDLRSQIEALQNALSEKDGMIGDLTVGHSFDNSRFIGDELTLTPRKARALYGAHFDVVDGRVVAFDKPRGAENRTEYVDAAGEPLGFDEAFKKIVDADPDRDHLIRSKLKPGADSKPTNRDVKKTDKPELRGLNRIESALSKAKS